MGILVDWNFTGGLAQIDGGGMAQIEGGMDRIGGDFIRKIGFQCPGLYGKYKPYITSFTSPILKMDYRYGGYCRFDFGQISIASVFFSGAGQWPPPKKSSPTVWYTPDTEANKEFLFSGVAQRQPSRPATGVSIFQLKSAKYATNLLIERENHDGEVVAMPRAFGQVSQCETVRLPDVNGKPHYWRCHLENDFDVHEDGVTITENMVMPAYDPYSFYLIEEPRGKITVSGTGDLTTISEIVAHYCTGSDDQGKKLLNLNYDESLGKDPSPELAIFETSQEPAIDWLSEACASCAHFFYIDQEQRLVLVDFASDNGASSLNSTQYSEFELADLNPVSYAKSEWTTFVAVEESVGKYVKSVKNEAIKNSIYTHGDPVTIKTFHTDRTVIESRLETILNILNGDWAEIIRPLDGSFPSPGKKYTLTETRGPQALTAVIRARELRFEIGPNPKLYITGNGTISS